MTNLAAARSLQVTRKRGVDIAGSYDRSLPTPVREAVYGFVIVRLRTESMSRARKDPREKTPLFGAVVLGMVVAAALSGPMVCSAAETGSASTVLTLGSDSQTFYLVDHGDTVSIYVNGVAADYMLGRLLSVGGPSYRTRVGLTRPVTMSLHRVSWRAMYDRMFSGLNVVYHFRGGKIDRIRVLSLIPGRSYKVATRPLESKETWMRIETGSGQAFRGAGGAYRADGAEDNDGGVR